MNPHNRNALHSAIATVFTLVAADAAEAVQLSAEGRGQVLLFPYYTTQADGFGNSYATLLTVVNAMASAKAVRVRFHEGRNSREVIDFNLFLSPFDVWTAAVLPDMTSGGAKVGTLDRSCTVPAFSESPTAPYVSFVNFAYSGLNDDGAGIGLDRTREGHFEVIEMATFSSSSTTGRAITHVMGVPTCTIPGGPTPSNPFPPFPPMPLTDEQAAADAMPPTGGLFGSSTLINVNSGTDYTVDATALANFYQVGANYQPFGIPKPDLTQALPPVSGIYAANGSLYESAWNLGTADAVSAVLMHDSLLNEFVMDTVTKSTTDWVITMPTKRYYVSNGTGNASKLFQRNFGGSTGSCDDIVLDIWNREENRNEPPPIILPGLPLPIPGGICWSANVVTFNGNGSTSAVFGSMNQYNILVPVGADEFQNGWMGMSFPTGISGAAPDVHRLANGMTSISGGGRGTVAANSVTYVGLPVIGFAAASFTNGTLMVGGQTVLSNYGGTFVHKTNTTIQ